MGTTARKVYFYCRDDPEAYHDDVVVLAEGLGELGLEVYGNRNYWQKGPGRSDWLVRHDPQVRHQDCDIVVVSYVWSRWIDNRFKVHEAGLPPELFDSGRRYRTAYVDLEDGYLTRSFTGEYREFDVIFRAKYNGRCFHPDNHVPWVLGISRRMLECTESAAEWAQRNPVILVNFNASHPYIHPARATMDRRFLPIAGRYFRLDDRRDDLSKPPADEWDALMWRQTQHRHCRDYYERLKHSQAIATFCGGMIPSVPYFPRYMVGGRRAKISRAIHELAGALDPRPHRLIQWDSWRFWEALAAGCLVFNFDLFHYGVRLPVMPENLTHYVGVTLNDVRDKFELLAREPDLARRISRNGRKWALENYSPVALARRFLDTMGMAHASTG